MLVNHSEGNGASPVEQKSLKMTLMRFATNLSRAKREGISLLVWLVFFISLIIVFTVSLTGYRIHTERQDALEVELGLRLLGIAETAALLLDGDSHAKIVEPADMERPEFDELRQLLRAVQKNNNIESPIYTLRRIGNLTRFVIMTDDPPYIGNEYLLTEKMFEVFESGSGRYTPLYKDLHGEWISAYAPIRNSNSEIEGLLELDYSVSTFLNESREHLQQVILISILVSVLSTAASILIALFISRPIRSQISAMNKMIESDTLSIRIGSHSYIKELNEWSDTFNTLTTSLLKTRDRVRSARTAAMLKLAALAEKRDKETGDHLIRMAYYCRILARSLQYNGPYKHLINDSWIDDLYEAAPLHDVGKVGIPDAILLKPGKLTVDEFKIMKTHAAIGEDILQGTDFFTVACEVAGGHHEKWDGSGYPRGLMGASIPLSARILALADVFDALMSKRVYKPSFSFEQAKEIILEGKGKHFDPEIVTAFLKSQDELVTISEKYANA